MFFVHWDVHIAEKKVHTSRHLGYIRTMMKLKLWKWWFHPDSCKRLPEGISLYPSISQYYPMIIPPKHFKTIWNHGKPIKDPSSHHFPMVFPWFSHDKTHGFPNWFSPVNHRLEDWRSLGRRVHEQQVLRRPRQRRRGRAVAADVVGGGLRPSSLHRSPGPVPVMVMPVIANFWWACMYVCVYMYIYIYT